MSNPIKANSLDAKPEIEDRPKIPDQLEVTFRGPGGETNVMVKSDVGADRTCIDFKVGKKIGAGPIQKVVIVNGEERRPVVPLTVEVKGILFHVNASLTDRRGPDYKDGDRKRSTDGILGNPVLEYFAVCPGADPET